MSDQKLRELGAHIEDSTPMPAFDDLERRARRRVAVRRTGILAAVVAVAVVAGVGVTQVADRDRQTSPSPVDPIEQEIEQADDVSCLTPRPNCFASIHGWIVYSDPGRSGIWAVNPAAPDSPEPSIQVTDGDDEEPLEWSRDGKKLLIRRIVPRSPAEPLGMPHVELVVLNADGTERRIAQADRFLDGSFSPDGSQVIYSGYGEGGILSVDSDGGTPEILLPAGNEVYNAVISPDGTRIAYFTGAGDHSHILRVMKSDGTDIRVVSDEWNEAGHIRDLAWSPDGRRLMVAGDVGQAGISIIGVDGSGLTRITGGGGADGSDTGGGLPAWSPDGARISFTRGGSLVIADADGTNATEFNHGVSGPWNPLPLDH
ncbi:hypothetical protein DDE18_15095 [Nocardioides gansuensis]|uniref:Lipoprotein LpqB beta-propeller domain-containing protein n=1 Tax=Nocardioides gansuensis TaxID=2138300 RepID=A0A2T8F8G1_9ACTN|nr:PD40 domain-containing protein [Nocardioides gansuensis]PVG82012.1 hypothetical protein DDE18_15095 [Nocardioides gansuensis]